jgi:hypothetical protein
MSSPETREARRRRLQRQAEGSRDVIAHRRNRKRHERGYTPPMVEDDPWSDHYRGEETHDESYYLDGEHELDFNDEE